MAHYATPPWGALVAVWHSSSSLFVSPANNCRLKQVECSVRATGSRIAYGIAGVSGSPEGSVRRPLNHSKRKLDYPMIKLALTAIVLSLAVSSVACSKNNEPSNTPEHEVAEERAEAAEDSVEESTEVAEEAADEAEGNAVEAADSADESKDAADATAE